MVLLSIFCPYCNVQNRCPLWSLGAFSLSLPTWPVAGSRFATCDASRLSQESEFSIISSLVHSFISLVMLISSFSLLPGEIRRSYFFLSSIPSSFPSSIVLFLLLVFSQKSRSNLKLVNIPFNFSLHLKRVESSSEKEKTQIIVISLFIVQCFLREKGRHILLYFHLLTNSSFLFCNTDIKCHLKSFKVKT